MWNNVIVTGHQGKVENVVAIVLSYQLAIGIWFDLITKRYTRTIFRQRPVDGNDNVRFSYDG